MNANSRLANFLRSGVVLTLLAACGDQMQPAKEALDRIDTTINASSADASRYAPGQLENVQKSVAELKAYYDRKDYAVVLARAPGVLADANGMVAVAAAKKSVALNALSADWSGLSASLPALIATVKAGLDARSRTAAPGVDRHAARDNLDDAVASWQKAQAAYQAGTLEAAVSIAHDAESKARAAAVALRLALPANA